MSRVTIVQRVLPHYRLSLFDKLNELLADGGIEMALVYGQERTGTVPKTVPINRVWAHRIENVYLPLFGAEIVWQPLPSSFGRSDLLIVEHASRLMLNSWLLLARKWSNTKIAFWGHGVNFQNKDARSLASLCRSSLARRADWWFAYTELSAKCVADQGYPIENITTLNNAIDTGELAEARSMISDNCIEELRNQLGIVGSNIAIYCGGLYENKRISFLLEACRHVRSKLSDFHLILIGDGPDRRLIEKTSKQYSWVHYVGPKFGTDRVPYFALSKVMLMPGMVGLAIVDSFVLGTPLLTTDNGIHSPEIAYLKNNSNGVMTENNVESYSGAVIEVLRRQDLHSALVDGCVRSSALYSVDQMAQRFAKGIGQCLKA